MYKKHLVRMRRLVQRYEPPSLQRTRGFICCAGVGQNVTVTILYLLVSLCLAIFCLSSHPAYVAGYRNVVIDLATVSEFRNSELNVFWRL